VKRATAFKTFEPSGAESNRAWTPCCCTSGGTALSVRGFTLIEIAVVLVVVSLVLGSLLVPLASQVEQRKIEGTEQILEQARDALLAFAAARGRLPCPAGTSGGQEALVTSAAVGDCASFWGFLPAATLGLSPLDANGYARDGWGTEVRDVSNFDQNRIRYAVRNANINAQAFVFTKAGGIRAAGMAAISGFADTNGLLYVCNAGGGGGPNCGTAFSLTSEAVAVVWSTGPNAATGGVSLDEAENPNPNGGTADRIFVSRPRGAGTGPEFDDQVVWITPPILFQRMIAAGQLP
jgi:prepilin-type N-terminal cleavage/methylation domain-containing protein